MVQVYIPGNENFTSNGDATLFCYNCYLIANLGGSWVLDVTIPIDQEGRWKYLTEEAVLKVDTWQKDKQLYRVAKVEKTENAVSAIAYPVFFDSANDAFLLDCRPTGKTGQQALDIMCAGTPYSGESNIGTIATAYFVRRNLMDAINGSASPTFIERWGGEILYDNYKVIINDRVGGDYGVEARYGRNIAGVVYAVDTAEIVTRIVPIAYNGYMMSGNTPWVDSPNVDKFAKVYTREVRYENIRMAQDAGSDEDVISCANQAELDAALRAAAEADFATGIDAPKVTIDIDMLAVLDMASRYEDALKDSAGADVHDTNDLQIITTWYRDYASLEVVRLGDTIRCRHSKLDITTTARVVSITWDCVRGKVTHIVLGDYKYDYIRTVNGAINRISNAVREDGSIIAEKVQGFLDGAQTQLRIQNSVADRVNTMAILFEDLDPDSPLYGALGIGTQGICISKTRTADGRDWDWTTGITANGMNASMGVFGILADKLGKNWINLDTGEISLGGGTEIGGKTIVEYMSDADQALAEYITQNDNRVTLIENQLDGQYGTYFEDYAPTLQNLPASNWTTQALKEEHEGDLFYDKSTGNSYRFFQNNGTWEWTLITDTVAAQALALASEAKDTADGKRRVFTVQPEPPYDEGDIYFTGTEILVCVNPKSTGSYATNDFVRKDAYNSQANFEDFVTNYNQTISGLQSDINDRIETWPQATDPSTTWDTTQDHTGDIWYDGDKLYYWDGSAWQEMSAAPTAEIAQSLGRKAQIFITQPTPPYKKGDLWFDSTEVGSADILTCIKDSGSAFAAADWRKCNKYIDDTELEALKNDISEITDDLQVQIDNKIETYRQATDPALSWATVKTDPLQDTAGNDVLDTDGEQITADYEYIKVLHEGDLWHRTTDNTEWRYHNGVWEPMDVPDSLWSEVNSKRQIFGTQPTPPYAVNDLWVQGETGDILRCKTARESGDYVATDWALASRYTGKEEFEAWLSGTYAPTIEALKEQADGKAETWHQATDPSLSWDDPELHYGDLWYNTTTQESFFWDGDSWESQSIPLTVFDTIDSKAQIFITEPVPPYAVGDLWYTGTVVKVCVKDSGTDFFESDWQKKDYYTDDSAIERFLTGEYADTVKEINNQLDRKIETWYQSNDPSVAWVARDADVPLLDQTGEGILDTDGKEITTDFLREAFEHLGDIWHDTDDGTQWRWSGGGWEEITVPDALIDKVDGKARIFVGTTPPAPPYDKGDMWITGNGPGDEVRYCNQSRPVGTYNAADWAKTPTETKAQTILQALNGEIIAKVVAGDIINAINLSSEGIKIDATKLTVDSSNININGVVSANNYFKVNLDGSIESTKGKFGNIIIDSDKVYTVGHDTATSTTAGFMLHSDGAVSIGNDANFLRFVKDSKTNTWGLQIALDDAAKLVIGDSTAATAANLKAVADTAKGDSDKAAKTATNFLYYDNANGLVISQNGTANGVAADAPAGSTAKPYNTQILGDGIAFREGLKILSKISGSGMVIYRPGSTLAKKMDLTDTGLNFYRNDGTTVVASYTDSGFNVSMGTIGKGDRAFVIDDRSIHNGTLGAANSVFISTGSSADASIAGSPSQAGWALAMGTDFGVTRSGALYAKSVNLEGRLTAASGSVIGAWTITDGSLTNGSMSIGSSGIRMGENFSVSSSGTVNAKDAHFAEGCTFGGTLRAAGGTFSGELSSATIKSVTGTIGGWTIADRKLHAGNIFLSPGGQGEDDDAVTICDREAKDWVIGAGSNFGVTTGGALYAKSGQIAGFTIGGRELSSTTGVYTAYMRSGSSASTKAFEAVETQPGSDPITHFSVTYGGKLYTDKADFGGIVLEDGAIYAGGHKSYNSSNAGFLLNKDGILSVGDGTNYIRYYKNDKDKWVLAIHASELTFGGVAPAKETDLNNSVNELIGRIDAADSAATDAQTAANTAQTTADEAKTAASTAQTTADSATTAAGDAATAAQAANDFASKVQENVDTLSVNVDTMSTNVQEALDTAEAANGKATSADKKADNAAKTATDYLSFVQGTGLYVAENQNYNSGAAVRVSSSSVDIMKSGNVRASFDDSSINFYRSSGNTAMSLGTSDLNFYKSDGTVAATLGTSGLDVKVGKVGGWTISSDGLNAGSYTAGSSFINTKGGLKISAGTTTNQSFEVASGQVSVAYFSGIPVFSKGFDIRGGDATIDANVLTTKYYSTTMSMVCYADGKLCKTTISSGSSRRYKDVARKLRKQDVEKFYKVKPVLASYKQGHLESDDPWQGVQMPMLIAEDIEAVYPKAVKYNNEGLVDDYDNHLIAAVHQQMLIDLHNEIKKLKAEIAKLKAIA